MSEGHAPASGARRRFAARLAALASLLPALSRAQPVYPARAIRFIVPFSPGGVADFAARSVASRLADRLGAPVIIDNRSGGGGLIGTEVVRRAPADGYTLLVTSLAYVIAPYLNPRIGYDPVHALVPVMLLAGAPNILVVHPGVPATTVEELVALARSSPGALTYGSSGAGTSTHLSAELFKTLTHVELLHVPYKGGGPAVSDLLAGQISMMFAVLPTVLQHVRAGRLRALGVTTATRFPGAMDIPTIAESGIAGYEVSAWTGMFAPLGTPASIVTRLAEALAAILEDASLAARYMDQGAFVDVRMPEAFAAFVAAESAKWQRVIALSGARSE